MAMNPMQKKARLSFLMGVLVTIVIAGAVIIFLFMQLKKYQDNEKAAQALLANVYVLNQDVKSGQEITEDMFEIKQVNKNTIPAEATSVSSVIDTWYMQLKDGTMVRTEYDAKENTRRLYYIDSNNNEVDIYKEDTTDNYYIMNGTEKQYIEMNNVPVVAKLDIGKNTVMTQTLVAQSDEKTTDDVRVADYNMIVLPADLSTGDYVDVRLMLPNGQDFVVVSKKMVTIPENADGTLLADTIRMNLREDEILSLSSAIVEAYGIQGSKLYAIKYKEAGLQNTAIPTYRPNTVVTTLMGLREDGTSTNPNIIAEAATELRKRYTGVASSARQDIQNAINADTGYDSQVQSGMQEGITNATTSRQDYIQSLTDAQ